jgi:hypothetical protein
MPRSSETKRRVRERRVIVPPEGIAVYTTSEKSKKEEIERKLREQEATRESD